MAELLQLFSEKLNTLDCPEDRKEALIDIKAKLSFTEKSALRQLAECDNFNKLFLCINENNDDAEIASDCICMLLEVLEPSASLKLYGVAIQRGLQHPSDAVKRNFLKLLLKYAAIDNLVLLITELPDLLSEVIHCLSCPDRGIAECSVQFFKKIGNSIEGVQILFSELFLNILKNKMNVNDITRFRIYEIVVDTCVKNNAALQASHESGILPSLLNELKSQDTLLQLNALELMTNLTVNSAGLLYLQREGAIKFLVDLIVNIKNEPLSFILLPGLIEFFGNLFKLQPAVFSQQHPEVFNLLFDNFDTVDPALLGVLITTIGKIGSSDDGKRTLLEHENKVFPMFNKFSELIEKKDSICLTTMNTLSVLMQTQDEALQIAACKKWFDALGNNALNKIVTNAKLPFVDLRMSALQLLGAVASQIWGAQIILHAAGLLEFLIDRDAEFDKDCKITKHNVITILASHPLISDIVSSDVIIKLRQHVNEGPFYVSAEVLISLEQA